MMPLGLRMAPVTAHRDRQLNGLDSPLTGEGVLQVKYLPTDAMPSDALTKALTRGPHERHSRVLLGLAPLKWEQQLQRKEREDAAAGKAAGGWRPGQG